LENYLAKYANYKEETFTALNTAFTNDGVFISIPENLRVDNPIQILNISVKSDSNFISFPRNLIIAEKNSKVQIVESFYHLSPNTYFNNSVSEIVVKENAKVDYVKIQDESQKSFSISNTQVYQERDSVFSSVSIDLGGKLVRNNLNVHMDAENCETSLAGFYLVSSSQLIDNHTTVEHAKPHCQSNELYKGILDDHSKAVFSGTVHVLRDAQKTNAFQENKNLLLSEDAEVNSKPQLKIFADDVRCTHGATIGQLDEEAVFYLRQRGISEKNAYSMLHQAFAADVFNYINIDPVRVKVEQLVMEKFKQLQK